MTASPNRDAEAAAPGRSAMQLLAGRFGVMTCGYAVSVILARTLGPADYAVYGVLISVLVSIELASAMGIPAATMQIVSDRAPDADNVVATANGVLVVGSLLVFAVLCLLAPVLAAALAIPDGTSLVRLAALDIPLAGLLAAWRGALAAERKLGLVSVNLVLYGLAKLGGTVALVLLGLSVAGALVVNAVATLAAILAVGRDVAVRRVRLHRSLALPLLRVALPIGLYAVLWQAVSGADLWLLKGIGDEEITSIGRYVAARTVAGVLSLVPTAFSFALFTWLTKAIASGDDVMARHQVRSIMRFAVIIVVPVVTVLVLNAEAIMALIFSTQYASGAAFLALQAVGFGLLAFLDTLLHAVMAGGQRYRATLALGAVVLLAIGANVVLAPAMGALGTGLALVVTAVAGTGAAVALAGRRFGVPVGLGTLIRVSLATTALVVVNVGLHADGPWVVAKLVALFATYAGVLAVCRELRWNDLDAVVVWRATA